MRKLREPGERPVSIVADKAYLPLHCNGNGMPIQAHAPACRISIPHESGIFIARWETEPHLTVHCRACRDHFFAANRTLPFDKKGETEK